MSWLYTIVFAGLMLSSQGSDVSGTEERYCQTNPVTTERPKGDETEKFNQTYPINADGRVNVSNVNGSITVEAWDRSEVKLEYTKIADSKERLADVEVKIESKPDYFSLETDYGSWKAKNGDRWRNGGKLTVEIRLMVPRGAVLNEIETVNGSVAVSNFTNITKVSAVNGSVNATNIRGTARLSTVNGEVNADFERLEAGSKISLETVNGSVKLVIPSDANAMVKADSLNGSITNDFGLPVRKGKYVGRDLYGRLGNGDVQIKLNSVNGALAIGRRNDGKTPHPATNLLPQKEKDEDEWDNDDSAFSSAKIDKEVAKATRQNAKSARAAVEAQVRINNITPEINVITAESVKAAAKAVEQAAVFMKSDEFKQRIKEAELKQKEMSVSIADAFYFPSVPRVEKKSNSFPVKGIPKVTLDAKGCSVTVRGWDKSEVQYRVTQFSDPHNGIPLKIVEDHSDSAVNITVQNSDDEARGGMFYNNRNRVRIEVFVPQKSNLKINANGEIRLEGVTGDLELTGSDEAINVRDVDGKLKVSNSDGRIRVIGFRGEIDAQTSDGMISLEGDFRKLTAKAGDGSVILTLPENTSADLEANCSEIRGDGIALTRVSGDANRSKYRIGKGGAAFLIQTDGEIHVRGADLLNESY